MRVAHFDCFSGISGDMTLAALIDAGVDAAAICDGIHSFGLPITIEIEKVKRNGIAATYVNIQAPEDDSHRHLADVEAILERGKLSTRQRDLARRIFHRIAEAEAKIHGMPIEKVHFHEVSALDSIADIVGAAIGLELLAVDRFTSRSVPPGSGTVKCTHGIMPVPAPATAELLKGVPLGTAPVKAELTTPTGAAILTSVVSEYTDQPGMIIQQIGFGAGRRDFWEQPNVLRLLVGEQVSGPVTANSPESDAVWILETNIDDAPAEWVGYCFDLLFAAGALDVFSIPIQMKKNRPGVLLSVVVGVEALPLVERILFRETGTFGIRRHRCERSKLQRETVTIETPLGPIRGKRGWRADLPAFVTPEYEDCARIAREKQLPLREVIQVFERSVHG